MARIKVAFETNLTNFLSPHHPTYCIYWGHVWPLHTDLSQQQAGPGPTNILQHKFYTKHSDWLLKFINQSGCLQISIA